MCFCAAHVLFAADNRDGIRIVLHFLLIHTNAYGPLLPFTDGDIVNPVKENVYNPLSVAEQPNFPKFPTQLIS